MKKLLLALCLTITTATFAAQTLDSIAAIVNKQVITNAQLNQQISNLKKQYQNSGQHLPPANELRQVVLQHMIYDSLQLQIAKRAGITTTHQQLSEAIEHAAKQKNLSVSDFFKQAEQQTGMTREQLTNQLKKQLIITKVQQAAVADQIQLNSKQVKQAQSELSAAALAKTEFHYADLVLPTLKQAQQAYAEITAGKDESKLAKADLGWVAYDNVPTLFVKVLSNMKTGDISKPISAPNGYHILKLYGKRAPKAQFSNSQVHQVLFMKQFQKKLQAWLKQLHDSAYIKIMNHD